VTVRSEATLSLAQKRALSREVLREQLGRLGETPFALAALDDAALAPGLFLPVSELNRVRQQGVDELLVRRDWAEQARLAERAEAVDAALRELRATPAVAAPGSAPSAPFVLSVDVFRPEDARAAAAAGATEVVFDPFLRHPAPPVSRVRALADELAAQGVAFRLRTPTVVRPEDRRLVQKWLDAGFALMSGHLGLVAEQAAAGRDVAADYAVNVFNQHTAAEVLGLGARRATLSVELTTDELRDVAAPWEGDGFDVVVYGRPEGMTIEHCVLSAAYERVATTCRDLCVQKHTNVELTDPAGYTFPVATDFACRNRLLHSRPIDGSEYLPRLWRAGLRGSRLLFNVVGDDVAAVVGAYRTMLDELAGGRKADAAPVRAAVGAEYTRGHFARAV
jgi:putative protease